MKLTHFSTQLALIVFLLTGCPPLLMAGHTPVPPGQPFVKGPFRTFLVTPCRVFDTRNTLRLPPTAPAKKIPSGTELHVKIRNGGSNLPTSFKSQGGSTIGCGIPPNAVGVFLNLVAIEPDGPGAIVAYQYPSPPTLASTINFSAGQIVANMVLLTLCDNRATNCSSDILVRVDGAASHLLGDVSGFLVGEPSPGCELQDTGYEVCIN